MLKRFINTLREVFKSLFRKKTDIPSEPLGVGDPLGGGSISEPTPAAPPIAPVEPVKPVIVEAKQEPDVTDPKSMITSFLWKPVSDTDPKVTVITVSCDGIKSEDLYVEVLGSGGRVLLGNKSKNPGSPRGNNLPGHKFGRINFKPGMTAGTYAKSQPLKVRFFVLINKIRTDIPIQGKAVAVIKDATVRWVMHNGKMSIDIKK